MLTRSWGGIDESEEESKTEGDWRHRVMTWDLLMVVGLKLRLG